jgi:hypothetical protein
MMMADIAHDLTFGDLAEVCPIDFHIFIAPNRAIIGSHGGAESEAFGIIGALESYGIWPLEQITAARMPVCMACPEADINDAGIITGTAAVFTYQYLLQKKVRETLIAWATKEGKRIAVHYDEIHHVPEVGSAWSEASEEINAIAACLTSWSGTWFRTDKRSIMGQRDEATPELTFCYPYADGIQDGIVRPVSFWIPDPTARTYSQESGLIIDERPVSEYLEELPEAVRKEIFNPDGWFMESMIRRADHELSRRRTKYRDGGCLVICPPGFHGERDSDNPAEQDRIAEVIYRRLLEITGKRGMLILNGDPASKIAEYRESDMEFLVAVNRVTEGCDIPRLRMALVLRELTELMFEQVLGRIIRRRAEDDEEPALGILPPIHRMCEYARRVAIAKKGVTPRVVKPCAACGRIPCKCPCSRCGKLKPCKCPCRRCGQRPCVCREIPLNEFAELEGTRDAHITHGTDIHDRFARRADAIRSRHDSCLHKDLAGMAFILQCDEEVNGAVPPTGSEDGPAVSAHVVATAANWVVLRDAVPVKVKKLIKFFRQEEKPYSAAWRHVNRKFFPGTKWAEVRDNPKKLSMEKLKEVHAYLDRAMMGGRL